MDSDLTDVYNRYVLEISQKIDFNILVCLLEKGDPRSAARKIRDANTGVKDVTSKEAQLANRVVAYKTSLTIDSLQLLLKTHQPINPLFLDI